jgi:hypothetical protein
MNKNFSDIKVGERFTINGKEYVRIQDVKVSCCRSINAQAVENAGERIFVQPTNVVTVNA